MSLKIKQLLRLAVNDQEKLIGVYAGSVFLKRGP